MAQIPLNGFTGSASARAGAPRGSTTAVAREAEAPSARRSPAARPGRDAPTGRASSRGPRPSVGGAESSWDTALAKGPPSP